ncbi:MAG: ROK family protein [Chloroflexota bacterium]
MGDTYRGINHRAVKLRNRSTVFRIVRDVGPISRIDLARQTGLNAATVTNIIEELLAAHLVEETGQGTSRVGRRPIFLEVNPSARLTLGIDLARDAITGAIVDLAGRVVDRFAEPAGPWLDGSVVLATVGAMVERLLAALPVRDRQGLLGIGIGAPGRVSFSRGRYLAPPAYGAWDGLALRQEVADRFGVPTYFDNNGNTSTLAELWFGAGQGIANFVLLTVGTGVGGGLVFDGDLYHGAHDLAGELGHMSVNLAGPRCACGNFGCLEMYVAVPRILAAARAALMTGEPSLLRASGRSADALTLDEVIAAAGTGDALASRILADVTRHLAAALVNLLHAFDPELILIGRDLARAGDLLLAPVRQEVQQRAMAMMRENFRLEIAALPDAPVIGAATLALREFFRAPLTDRYDTVA